MCWVQSLVRITSMIVLGLSVMSPDIEQAFAQAPGMDDIKARLLVFPRNKTFKRAKILFTVTKKTTGSILFWKRHESYLEWEGAEGNVVIYHSVSCASGFTSRRSCKTGLKKISTGGTSGKFSYPYHHDDYFRVCELGIEVGKTAYDFHPKEGCSNTLKVPHHIGEAHHGQRF